jgi:hypothetical protein
LFLNHDTYLQEIPQLVGLFQRSFGRSLDPQYLKWRYVDNPCQDLLVNVHFENEAIVANYSASPCMLKIDGQSVKTALSMTTMTDPMFAGRGLFNKLACELYEYMTEKNYAMVWGFPNSNSHYAFMNKLKWVDIYEIPTMKFVLNKRVEKNIIYTSDNQFLLNYERSQYLGDLIHVVKNAKYLQWRYASNPNNQYTNLVISQHGCVSSYCVIKRYNQQVDIVDLQAQNRDEGQSLLLQAIQWASENDLGAVNCWAPRHHFMHGLCERLGFTNGEPVTYLGARTLSTVPQSKRINDYSRWYLQMGDSDVY